MKKLFFILLILMAPGFAAEDYYRFDTPKKEQQFQTLIAEFRCLVCQNQNLAESNSPLASDLREQIYQRVQQNQSNPMIVNYLVDRYGNYVLYRPPFNRYTIVLWLAPFSLLIIGFAYLLFYLNKKRRETRQ